jgi:hypothetical protein
VRELGTVEQPMSWAPLLSPRSTRDLHKIFLTGTRDRQPSIGAGPYVTFDRHPPADFFFNRLAHATKTIHLRCVYPGTRKTS